jgi:polyketide biosynthesis enoyl-CoA hydratase PksH
MTRMAVLAETYDARAALAMGLADEVHDRPPEAVRRLLLALRRMPRDNVGELKTCRRLLNPPPPGYAEHATRLLRRIVADPAVRERITRLREEGALR